MDYKYVKSSNVPKVIKYDDKNLYGWEMSQSLDNKGVSLIACFKNRESLNT